VKIFKEMRAVLEQLSRKSSNFPDDRISTSFWAISLALAFKASSSFLLWARVICKNTLANSRFVPFLKTFSRWCHQQTIFSTMYWTSSITATCDIITAFYTHHNCSLSLKDPIILDETSTTGITLIHFLSFFIFYHVSYIYYHSFINLFKE